MLPWVSLLVPMLALAGCPLRQPGLVERLFAFRNIANQRQNGEELLGAQRSSKET